MKPLTLRDILNKYKWHFQRLDDLMFFVRQRNEESVESTIPKKGNLLDEILSEGITFDDIGEEAIYIPYHRITHVQDLKTGEWVYLKKDK